MKDLKVDQDKIPLPPLSPSATLHKSVKFWSRILLSLDKQFAYMEDNLCYGRIAVEFKFWNGKLTDQVSTIIVSDRITSGGSKKKESP